MSNYTSEACIIALVQVGEKIVPSLIGVSRKIDDEELARIFAECARDVYNAFSLAIQKIDPDVQVKFIE